MFLMNVLHTSVAFIFAFLLYLQEDIRNQENKGGKQTPKLVVGHKSCVPPGKKSQFHAEYMTEKFLIKSKNINHLY